MLAGWAGGQLAVCGRLFLQWKKEAWYTSSLRNLHLPTSPSTPSSPHYFSPCRLVEQCEKEGLRKLHDDLQIHHQRLQASWLLFAGLGILSAGAHH